MGQCIDCPRIADRTGISRCCMDDPPRAYTFDIDVARERETFLDADRLEKMLLRIPGRSAERGEVTHKLAKDMNRKERRAFLSSRSR